MFEVAEISEKEFFLSLRDALIVATSQGLRFQDLPVSLGRFQSDLDLLCNPLYYSHSTKDLRGGYTALLSIVTLQHVTWVVCKGIHLPY